MEWFEKKKISVRQNLPWFEKETKIEYAYPVQDRQEKEAIQQHSSLHQNLESLRFSMGLPNAPVSIAKEKKTEKNLGSFFKEDKKQTPNPNKKSLRHFSNLTIVENTAPTVLENEESPVGFEKNLDDIFDNNPYSFIRVKENFEQPPSQVVRYPHNQATEKSHSFAQQVTESVKKHFDFPQAEQKEPTQKFYQSSFASQNPNMNKEKYKAINDMTADFKNAFDDYLQKRESVSKNKSSLKKQYIPNKEPFSKGFLKNKTNNPFLEKLNVQDSFQYKQKLKNPQTGKLQFSLQEHLSKKAQTPSQSFDLPPVQEKPAQKDLVYRNSQKQDRFAVANEFVYRYSDRSFAQPNSPYSISLNSVKDQKKEDQKQTLETKTKQPLQSNEPATFSQDYKLKGNKDFATAMFAQEPKKQKPTDHIEIKINPHRKKTEPKFDLQAEKKKLETFSFLEEAQKNVSTKGFLPKDRSEQTPNKEFDFSFDKSAFALKDSPKEAKTNSQAESQTKNTFANINSQEVKSQEIKNITFKSPTQPPRATSKQAKKAKDVKEQPQLQKQTHEQNKDEKDLLLAHENQKNLKDFLEKHKGKMDKQHNLRQSRVIINEEFHPTPAVVQPIYQWQDSVSVHSKKEDDFFEDVVWRSETISEQNVLPPQQLTDDKQKTLATEKLTKDLSQEHSLEAIAEKKNDIALNQGFELEENEIPKQQHLQKPLEQESRQNIEPQEPDFGEEKNQLPIMDEENLQEEQQDIEAVQFNVQATKEHVPAQNQNVAIQEKTAKEDFSSPVENLAEEKDSKNFSQHERASITPHVSFNKQFFLKMNTLQKNKNRFVSDPAEIQAVILKLEETLNQFNIEGRVVGIQQGPIITRYEIKIPPGIKVSRLLGLTDELAMALEAFKVRIEAPIPGRSTAGIEIPNKKRQTVYLGDIINDEAYLESEAHLPLPFGKDIAGGNVITDLAKMPHLLIAGATGSGKSVAVNSFITSLILHKTPEEVRFILIDPKLVELSHYNDIPHLLHPVITDHVKAILALNWAVEEMERRYEDLVDMRVRDIRSYNEKVREHNQGEIMPYIVVLIDELGDLMMVAGKDVESSIIRLTQKARAVGIHMILATQRPSVDVITALIKANCPARISLQVAQRTDSRTILDGNGAEQLLGKGDMLFKHPSQAQLQRIQCPYVEDYEVEEVVKQVKNIGKPSYIALDDPRANGSQADPEDEELMDEAWEIITESQKASASYLQRRLRIGYNRAARIIEAFEARGWIGPQMGSKPREILA